MSSKHSARVKLWGWIPIEMQNLYVSFGENATSVVAVSTGISMSVVVVVSSVRHDLCEPMCEDCSDAACLAFVVDCIGCERACLTEALVRGTPWLVFLSLRRLCCDVRDSRLPI